MRYYDPATAQFMSRDPMVSVTMSPYAYVSGNPLNWRDAAGLAGCPAALVDGRCISRRGTAMPADAPGATGTASGYQTDAYESVSIAEAENCFTLSFHCFQAVEDANEAESISQQAFPGSDVGRKEYRHALWSTFMSYDFGAGQALDFCSAYERGHPNSPSVGAVDAYNNSVGATFGDRLHQQYGDSLTHDQIRQIVFDAVMSPIGPWREPPPGP